ncbi:MAG: 30S ribosomal protein S12 methylthiotransferase RimO [Bacilli bacterium]|nr:30S ribosomal protein S12 methylthiotransferase RimO [Bacilli bacterium]MDY6392353.1 30S ribosomal protein S12 methylthiotransferase RimO [Bacilli bacterium]
MKKIGLISLGCAKNLVDSEMILAMFPHDRFAFTTVLSEADFIIVNTCGFIESAKRESIDTILGLAKYKAKVIVVGCLAQRYLDELKELIPEADLIVAIKDYGELHNYFKQLMGEEDILPMNPLRRVVSTSSFTAYLRISEGCNNFCSFCAIPFIRGRFVSRPYEEILTEARQLKEQGVKEISLISQDTTIYGQDFPNQKPNICDLLRALEEIGFYSIRLLYLYPSEISDELIDLIASSKAIAHYFDIPVQCASDKLLKLMKRHCDQKETVALFHKIKQKCPDAVLRTTLIAGFSGETIEDQRQTLKFLEDIRFDHMGCFTYSPEEGTYGATLPHKVRTATKQKRANELMAAQRKISYELNKARVGEVMEGLVIDQGSRKNEYRLRSYWNAPDDIDGNIYFSSQKPLQIGDVVKVRITGAFVYDLHGELVE